jgi:acetyl esterase/lipase
MWQNWLANPPANRARPQCPSTHPLLDAKLHQHDNHETSYMRYLRFFVLMETLFLVAHSHAASTSQPAVPATGDVVRLWPDRAPRALGDTPADIPTLTAYLPQAGRGNGCAVVVCPGGGYSHLAMGHEGTDIAKWLNDHGIAAFVLTYRIKPYGQPVPMLDGQRAIRTVRYHAKAWGIDWKRIGIMGFSAGGHVASTVGTHWDPYIPASPDPINGQSCRPDFMILVYPVITMRDKITHAPSREILLGDHPPQKLIDFYSNELQVKDDTPPTFIVASKTDKTVPVKNSELFYQALQSHKIPSEFLELETGGHGYGMAPTDPKISIWTDHCLAWMTKQGLTKPAVKKPT